MIFSSWQFIFIYFWFNSKRLIVIGKIWLVLASLFFYGFWNIKYIPLLIMSILVNYFIGTQLARGCTSYLGSIESKYNNRKIILILGIVLNLVLLAYYKYTNFFIHNINLIMGTNYSNIEIILPLAISFFTFTQIAYLVDSYHKKTAHYNLLSYSLFVTYFPHLIAGPIVHHHHIMPQFDSFKTLKKRNSNIINGLIIFTIGLFKKVVIADTFSYWVTLGFDSHNALNFYEAWGTSLSYTFPAIPAHKKIPVI